MYGEDIAYECDLIKPEDAEALRVFSCGNKNLDYFFHKELIAKGKVNVEDGLPYKFYNTETGEIYAVVSLAASGIIHHIDGYTKILPAIKVDVLAVDTKYQKLHLNVESEASTDADEHFYFADKIMCDVVKKCRAVAEKEVTARYILLYADEKALRYYQRNYFSDFTEYMEREHNMEIEANTPMYLEL